MGIIDSLIDGTLNLVNLYQQGRALFDVEGHEGKAEMAYIAKSVKQIMEDKAAGKPIGSEIVSKGINALVDYKVTTGMYDYLTSGDNGWNPVMASLVSKSLGLVASSLAGKLAGGIADKIFTPNDTMDNANEQLAKNGRLNDLGKDPSMLARLQDMMGGGKDVTGSSAPLGGSGGFLKSVLGI